MYVCCFDCFYFFQSIGNLCLNSNSPCFDSEMDGNDCCDYFCSGCDFDDEGLEEDLLCTT